MPGGSRCLLPVAAGDARGQPVEFHHVAPCLGIPGVELQGAIDFLVEAPRQKQLLYGIGTLRRDSDRFGHLSVEFRHAAVECNSLFRQRQWGSIVAEGVTDLGEQEIREGIVGPVGDRRFDQGAGPFPMSLFDQNLGRSLRRDRRGHGSKEEKKTKCHKRFICRARNSAAPDFPNSRS